MSNLRLYLRYVGIGLKSQLQYRASTIMLSLGQFLLTGIEILAIWALFARFGHLDGWTLPEVALLYGLANTSLGIAEFTARGFDVFSRLVKSGDFDRILLRPRSTALQVSASEVYVMRFGRLAQGLLVLGWAAIALNVVWTGPKLLLLLASLASGAAIFSALFMLQATLAFWTIEGLEIANTVTYGGVETTTYPLAIYEKWFRRFFTFVVPLACMSYFPMLAITGRPDPLGTPGWVPWVSPLVGFVFLAICLRVWRVGVRHYRSTGS